MPVILTVHSNHVCTAKDPKSQVRPVTVDRPAAVGIRLGMLSRSLTCTVQSASEAYWIALRHRGRGASGLGFRVEGVGFRV